MDHIGQYFDSLVGLLLMLLILPKEKEGGVLRNCGNGSWLVKQNKDVDKITDLIENAIWIIITKRFSKGSTGLLNIIYIF